MSWSQFFSEIDPCCLKVNFSYDEYSNIKNTCPIVNSTTLYLVYKTTTDNPMPYKDFYVELKKYFYYDKYVCRHGIEFLYYVKMKHTNIKSTLPIDIVDIIEPIKENQ